MIIIITVILSVFAEHIEDNMIIDKYTISE